MENFRPFDDAKAKMETLNGGLNDLTGGNGKLGPCDIDGAMEHLRAFWWRNRQIRENWGPWWPDGEIGALDHEVIFKRFNTAPLQSFKLIGPKF